MPYLNGAWTDFISDFMSYTEGALSSEIHRRWSSISTVAGALERRVWISAGDRITFPNLYIILVAPPGTGKYIIETTRHLWSSTKRVGEDKLAFKIAPDSVSRASLIDDLASSKQTFIPPTDPIYTYHSLLIPTEEFEVLLPDYDPQFVATLNAIWTNKSHHEETRRHGPLQSRDIRIPNPQFNILAGATPAYFTAHFPDETWNTGLIRRIILVFCADLPTKDIFAVTSDRSSLEERLLHRLSLMSNLYGPAEWHPEAAKTVMNWHLAGLNNNGGPPTPTHSKLVHYCKSRTQHILKLCLISAVARSGELKIEPIDVTRAMEWLFEAENFMPDVFRAMKGKSDIQVIEELHLYLQSTFIRNKSKPIPGGKIHEFLGTRLPSEKVPPVFMLAQNMGIIARFGEAVDLWIPRPKQLEGME